MRLTTYNVYAQCYPIIDPRNDTHKANLRLVGKVQAYTGAGAMANARIAYGLRHPVVHELDRDGKEIERETPSE